MRIEEAYRRAEAIVDKMTVEEMATQLRYNAPAIPRLNIPAYNWWNEALHGVARAGTATVFPQAINLAATFDDTLVGEMADVIAAEGRAKFNMASAEGDRDIYKGLTFWSPNVNLFRDPRWGRGHETYGEDPYLTSRMGVSFVKHLQGEGEFMKAAACAKHFAVHSGPESKRHSFDAQVSDKDLWESYLPAFEALVREAGVEAIMGAYNRTNGEPCCGSKTLLTDILRDKWGFKGHVVSDCWAIRDFHTNHMVTSTAPQSVALALKNGCDLNCGNMYLNILIALQEGLITSQQIRQAAIRLMAARIRLGLMEADPPYANLDWSSIDTDSNAALAYKLAQKSMVLLKNDGILPLNADKLRSIAVIGPNADSIRVLEGNYNGTSSRYTTFLEGIRAACDGKLRVLYAQGCHLFRDRTEGLAEPDDRLAEAVSAAHAADVVILSVGLDATLEGEEGDASNLDASGDKVDLELPLSQQKLIRAVLSVGKPTVTVLSCGSAIHTEAGNALLWTGYPGQAGGLALADLLFGAVSPSGKLPITFYRSVTDLPPFEDYSMAGRTYRYFMGQAEYPFGYGLSYTAFSYEDARLEGKKLIVRVKNTGEWDADEIVQVYVRADSPFAPPHPRLCGFKRVFLRAGGETEAEVLLDPVADTVVNEQGERIPCKACEFFVGGSQLGKLHINYMAQ